MIELELPAVLDDWMRLLRMFIWGGMYLGRVTPADS